ncbi:unnamed protein product [Chrysoparadoxa australica]
MDSNCSDLCMVMELMDSSWDKMIFGRLLELSLDERAGVLVDVCRGLSYLHAMKITYRDIKSANVLVRHHIFGEEEDAVSSLPALLNISYPEAVACLSEERALDW